MDIKPIETPYHGYRFRSRLEARYAVFFDLLGMEYEYEKEGYKLGKYGQYLPDFWMPYSNGYINPFGASGVWLEVKGQAPSQEELDKLGALAETTHTFGLLAWGLPAENDIVELIGVNQDMESHLCNHLDVVLRLTPEEQVVRHLISCAHYYVTLPTVVRWAADKAKSARFEFSESGAK